MYCRIDQVKRKKAYTKITSISTIFKSNTSALVRAANGISSTSSVALSVVPNTASRPPMIRIVVEAKNDGLVDRAWITTPSSTLTSRCVTCNIHSRRIRFVVARIEACDSARRRAKFA